MSGYNSKKRKASGRSTGNGRSGSGTSTGRTVHPGTGRGTTIPVNGDLTEHQRGHIPVDNSVPDLSDPSNPYLDGWSPSDSSSFPGVFDSSSRRSFDDVLAEFSQTGDIQNTLAMLGFGDWQSLDKSQVQDWNKQLLEQLLQYILELEKRKYNEEKLQEQRTYDNAQNQLARLMGAGISRDAALQLLGEQQQPIQTEGTAQVTGPAPSESMAREVEAKQRTLNTAISAIGTAASAFGGLASFGVSAATTAVQMAATRAATANTLLNNQQLSKTLNGIDVASSVIGALSSYEASGKTLPEFKSVSHMMGFVRSHMSDYEPFKALDESGVLGKIPRDVYSLTALNDGYMSWRKAKDYGIDRDHLVKMQAIEELRGAVDIDKVDSEIKLNKQYVSESIISTINDNLRTQSQIELNTANINLLSEQTLAQQYENVFLKQDSVFYEANIDDINSVRLGQIMIDSAGWNALKNNPKEFEQEVTAWLMNRTNARTVVALESLYYGEQAKQAVLNKNSFAFSGLRDNVLFWHNLFQFGIKQPAATSAERNALGAFAGSSAALFLYRNGL